MDSQKGCLDASYSILQNYVRNIVQQRGWTGTESAANDDLTRLNNLLSNVEGILLNVFPDGSIHSIYGLMSSSRIRFQDNFRSDGKIHRVLKRRNQQYLRIIRNASLINPEKLGNCLVYRGSPRFVSFSYSKQSNVLIFLSREKRRSEEF